MPYQTFVSIPITINLLSQALTTGWTISGNIATHEACNAGSMFLKNYPLTTGITYKYSYRVISISGGNVQAKLGTASGASITTAGFVTETVTATGVNPILSFYSNADCQIEVFSIKTVQPVVNNKRQDTIAYSEKLNKWFTFLSFNVDVGFSMFTDLFAIKDGDLYHFKSGSTQRNNFFGVQYDSIINFVANKEPSVPKSFLSLSLQCNELLITTTDGITTSLGQVSELSDIDFVKDFLSDGVSKVNVFNKEGVYSASFLRDKNDDLLNGTPLKGNYMTIELKTTSNIALNLFTVQIISNHSAIGAR